MQDLLTTRGTAPLLRTTPEHVRELVRSGYLPGLRVRPRGRILFDKGEVEAALQPALPQPCETTEES